MAFDDPSEMSPCMMAKMISPNPVSSIRNNCVAIEMRKEGK
jgi:hypothetical protein